ncbi:uncharacterized protein QC763_201390 [Podospora pseudopauciseta]|uniref:Uncharacterized protein n=1 Tax=Podospora pseudopauciseta TaxID=2093780 RepID=A0ABR0HN40_9PEZI|nr:hypothetical protein QC763_201390 [Podospora pseudopauciseta]
MDPSYPPRPRPPLRSATSGSVSRISTVSDITDFDNFRDETGAVIPPRPSLVSLQSNDSLRQQFGKRPYGSADDVGHTYGGALTGWTSFMGNGGGAYEPVSSPTLIAPSRNAGPSFAQRQQQRRHDAIPEEEDGIDLGLMKSAAPLGGEEPPAPGPRVSRAPTFDVSSALGPATKADEEFWKAIQEQEAQGKLTGGLGKGIKAEATITEDYLLAITPVTERPPSRTFSVSRRSRRLSHTDTVKKMAQNEANKRGEVIEVVMTEDTSPQSKFDLSLVGGHDPNVEDEPGQFAMRQTTFPTNASKTEVFYPQPNWKPFSMRWPYLIWLIVVSIVMAVSVEILYRSSAQDALVKFQSPNDISTAQYFAVKFLPMAIAVTYGVMWQVTNFDVMRLEPFYQLSKEGGALADESINVEYLTQFVWLRPFRAIHCKHYAVAVSSTASLLANTLVPALGAASLIITPDRNTRLDRPHIEKSILIHHVWSRLLTTLLVIIAAFGCVLFYQLQTRRSGLLADVKGIAGLAAMATVSHILMDFKDMDVATHQDIHSKLKDHRYVLRNSSLAPDDTNPPSIQEREKYTKNHLSANPHPMMLRPAGAYPLISGIFAFIALIPIFLFTPATVLTDRAPWLITVLAVCIKLSWGALETDVRLMQPYYLLSQRHAPPKTLTLDYTAMPFGWVAIRGLINKHWLVFFVGFGTILTEILTVLVTSLATVEGRVFISSAPTAAATSSDLNAGQETIPSFWISFTLALLILLYMGVLSVVTHLKRRRVFLPRQPNTIASVLAYIHQSKMLYDFVGTAKFGNREMEGWLEGVGKRYGLGWFRGRDGQSHCGVDEEELVSEWRVGYDYSRATRPWEEEGRNWL